MTFSLIISLIILILFIFILQRKYPIIPKIRIKNFTVAFMAIPFYIIIFSSIFLICKTLNINIIFLTYFFTQNKIILSLMLTNGILILIVIYQIHLRAKYEIIKLILYYSYAAYWGDNSVRHTPKDLFENPSYAWKKPFRKYAPLYKIFEIFRDIRVHDYFWNFQKKTGIPLLTILSKKYPKELPLYLPQQKILFNIFMLIIVITGLMPISDVIPFYLLMYSWLSFKKLLYHYCSHLENDYVNILVDQAYFHPLIIYVNLSKIGRDTLHAFKKNLPNFWALHLLWDTENDECYYPADLYRFKYFLVNEVREYYYNDFLHLNIMYLIDGREYTEKYFAEKNLKIINGKFYVEDNTKENENENENDNE